MNELIYTLNNGAIAAYSIMFTVYFVAMIFKKTTYNISYLNLFVAKMSDGFKILIIFDLILVFFFRIANPFFVKLLYANDMCSKFVNKLFIIGIVEIIVFIFSYIVLGYVVYTLYKFSDEEFMKDRVIKFLNADKTKFSVVPEDDSEINYLEIIKQVFNEKNIGDLKKIITEKENLKNYYCLSLVIELDQDFDISEYDNAVNILRYGLYSHNVINTNKYKLLKVIGNFEDESDRLLIANIQTDRSYILNWFEEYEYKLEDRTLNLSLFNKLSIDDIISIMIAEVGINYELSEVICSYILSKSINEFDKFLYELASNDLLNNNRKFLDLLFNKTAEAMNNDELFMRIFGIITTLNKYEISTNKKQLIRVFDDGIKRKIDDYQIVLVDEVINFSDLTATDDLNSLELLKRYAHEEVCDYSLYFKVLREYIISKNNFSTILKNDYIRTYQEFSNRIDKKISILNLNKTFNTSIMPNGAIINGESQLMFKNLNIEKVVNENVEDLIIEFKKFVDDNVLLIESLIEKQAALEVEKEKNKLLIALQEDNWNALLITMQWYVSYFERGGFTFNKELLAEFSKEFRKFKMKKPFQDLILNIKVKYIEDYQLVNKSYRTISILSNNNFSNTTWIANMLIDLVKGIEYALDKQIEIHTTNTYTLQNALLYLKTTDITQLNSFQESNYQIGGYSTEKFTRTKYEPQNIRVASGTANAYLKLNTKHLNYIISFLKCEKNNVDREWLNILEQLDNLINVEKAD